MWGPGRTSKFMIGVLPISLPSSRTGMPSRSALTWIVATSFSSFQSKVTSPLMSVCSLRGRWLSAAIWMLWKPLAMA